MCYHVLRQHVHPSNRQPDHQPPLRAMNLMNLMIVRHAQSAGNAEGRWQGRADFRLSDAGRGQAGRLRSRLKREGYTPTHIYSSPLSRTFETARIASSIWDRPIEAWDDLMENDVGVFSGLTWADVEKQFPEVARDFAATRNLDLVDGAETHAERSARAQRVVDRVIGEHHNSDRVLLFSHGGIMTHIVARLLGADRLWGLGIRNTAIFEFAIDVDSWRLDGQSRANVNLWRIDRFNDASHLDDHPD